VSTFDKEPGIHNKEAQCYILEESPYLDVDEELGQISEGLVSSRGEGLKG